MIFFSCTYAYYDIIMGINNILHMYNKQKEIRRRVFFFLNVRMRIIHYYNRCYNRKSILNRSPKINNLPPAIEMIVRLGFLIQVQRQ